jgi:D-glycero-D-manno-heptose 1,7-bisphosphate phosphatase
LDPIAGNRGKTDLVNYLISTVSDVAQILPIVTSSYFADTGTSDRLKKVQQDYKSGVIARRGKINQGAIFIDRDGCLVPDIPQGRVVITESDFEIQTINAIRSANQSGIPIFLITNQPAIAKGFISFNDVERIQMEVEKILSKHGAILDDYMFCPHHPTAGYTGEIRNLKIPCGCRKPNPGMAIEIARWHGINLRKSVVIGDSENDRGLAKSIDCKFILARHSLHEVGKAVNESIEFLSDNF